MPSNMTGISLNMLLLLSYFIALCSLSLAQSTENPTFQFNIGGPGLFGYTPEQFSWISPGGTKTSILNGAVSSTLPGFVIKTHRWAQFSYNITIPFSVSGIYSCSLYWAETSAFFEGAGKRIFDIALNGRKLNNIDVFAAVGFRTEFMRKINDVPVDTELNIQLLKVKGDPFLSGVICTRTAPLPVGALPSKFDLNLGGPSISNFFAEQREWLSSPKVFTAFTNDVVSGTQPSFFTGTHRWSQSTWNIRIPIAKPGVYTCDCYWAETSRFFRADNKRVFDISLNNVRINNIDVHKTVGFLAELKRTFVGVRVNGLLTATLFKKRGDPFLAGVSCSRTGNL